MQIKTKILYSVLSLNKT